MNKKIRGKIIRIVDATTVVINLGELQGITTDNIFSILSIAENIIDPFKNNEELGNIVITKAKVKAVQVSDKFTIASSKWNEYEFFGGAFNILKTANEPQVISKGGDLNIDESQVEPWKALSESPISLGDIVETTITEPESERKTNRKASDTLTPPPH